MSWRRFLERERNDADLAEEIELHLAAEAEENAARGMNAEEARRQAILKFGNPQVVRENLWRQNTVTAIENLWRDLRHTARTLLRQPGFTLIAVLVMALCLGATTSLFTIARAVLLRPLPFKDPDRLVMVYERFQRSGFGAQYNVVSPADYADWRSNSHGFEDMGAWRRTQFNLSGDHAELPEVVRAVAGTWNFFSVLGVRPALGRTFLEAEDQPGTSRVAMISWNLFQRRFGGDPTLIGKQIRLDANAYSIVGVLPQWFSYPDERVQVWVPYKSVATAEQLSHHDFHQTYVVARLKPQVTLQSAMSEIQAIQYHIHTQHLSEPVAEGAASRSIIDDLAQDVKTPLLVLLAAVGCMLLIGCLNVANLLVARGAARQKEVAIRGALGADRFTLIRQQMVESFLICAVGGVVGVLMSLAATTWLVSAWRDLPRVEAIHADGLVLTFACALVFIAALLAGLVPAVSSTRKAAFAVLQDSSRSNKGSLSRTTLRKTLLTIEIAVTVVLLVSAGLLFKSFISLRTSDLGATTKNVLTMHYALPKQQYDTPEKVVAFNENLLERLHHLPGVVGVGLGSVVPGAGYGGDYVFTVPEHPPVASGEEMPDANYRMADPEYFNALQIPLLSGRVFTPADRLQRSDYVIISQQLEQEYFHGENPLGQHIHVPWNGEAKNYEIIGVAGDTLYQAGLPSKATMYFPVFAGPLDRDYTLVVRSSTDPLSLSLPVQKTIANLDASLPVSEVMTMDAIVGQSAATTSFSATLVMAFAVLSLLLAAVGLFGVLSYMVAQRSSEIGIRMALGAQRDQVLRQMLGDGLRPALIGLGVGLAACAAITRLIASMLFGTRPLDPTVLSLVAAALLLVAASACALPAWQASRLNPMQALRLE
jgi:predicted permease